MEKVCCHCGNEGEVASEISIMDDLLYVCKACMENKVGQVAKCDKCGNSRIIASQDEVFQRKLCKPCLDEDIAYLKQCHEFYLAHQSKEELQ